MNSAERKEARYQRRQAKRAANRKKRLLNCTYENVIAIPSLYNAAFECARGTRWKSSVQHYVCRAFENSVNLHNDLAAGKDIREGVLRFWLWERGKHRLIATSKVRERVVQKSIARNALVPALTPTLTAGCSANLKGRGLDYAVKRLKKQLVDYYKKNGSDGYILLVDFSDYFGSIDHDVCKQMVDKALDDSRLKDLINKQIDQYGSKGLGLGAEPNQMLAVALPNAIDHYLLMARGVSASGRYMDDTYAIGKSKKDLLSALEIIRKLSLTLKLVINEKKTKLVKLTHGFIFLKRKFSYGEHGRIYIRPARKSIIRIRRRMKLLAKRVKNGLMSYAAALQSWQSLRGTWIKLDAHRSVLALDSYFKNLYKDWSNNGRAKTARA